MILLQLGLEQGRVWYQVQCPVSSYSYTLHRCYLGHAILWLLPLQMSRQLQGHLTYLEYKWSM